jgi:GT2 family glycosyltransferase
MSHVPFVSSAGSPGVLLAVEAISPASGLTVLDLLPPEDVPHTRERVAVLLSSHNRREQTLACLASLEAQPTGSHSIAIETWLLDAASSDGTREAVSERFPSATVILGSADLFWAGGMRVAFEHAAATSPDHFLLLNDDVLLYEAALSRLLETHAGLSAEFPAGVIVVGAVQDPDSGTTTYSGVVRPCRARPLHFERVEPSTSPRPSDTFNGNVALIPARVARRVGPLAPEFRHGMADFDYGLRAAKLGISTWVAPGYAGSCKQGGMANTWKDLSLPARKRWRLLLSAKGLPSSDWFTFTRRHAGWLWLPAYVAPYVTLARGTVAARFRRIGVRLGIGHRRT